MVLEWGAVSKNKELVANPPGNGAVQLCSAKQQLGGESKQGALQGKKEWGKSGRVLYMGGVQNSGRICFRGED